MTRFRLAVWPLIISGVFLIATILGAVLLPSVDPTLTVGGVVVVDNIDLITLALGGLTLIFASLSFLLRKGPLDPADELVTIKPVKEPKAFRLFAAKSAPDSVDLMAAYDSMNPPVEIISEDRVAARAAADEDKQLSKAEKARAAEAAKFQKQAQKDAARAEKMAARANKRGKKLAEDVQVDEVSTATANEWIASIHNAHGAVPDVQNNDGTEDETSNERVVYELDDVLVPAASEAPSTPSWLMAAYEDPNFQIPFSQQPEAEITEADAEVDLIVADEIAVEDVIDHVEAVEAVDIEESTDPVHGSDISDESFTVEEAADIVVESDDDQLAPEPIVEPIVIESADIADALAEEDGWDIPEAAPAEKLGWLARRKAAKAAKAQADALERETLQEELAAAGIPEPEAVTEETDEVHDVVFDPEATIANSVDDPEHDEVVADEQVADALTEEQVEEAVVATSKKRGWFSRKRGKHEAEDADYAEEADDASEVEEVIPEADEDSADALDLAVSEPAVTADEEPELIDVEAAEVIAAPVTGKPKKKVRGARRKRANARPIDDEQPAEEILGDEAIPTDAESVDEITEVAIEQEGPSTADLVEAIADSETSEAVAQIEEVVAAADDAVADEPEIVLPFDDVYVAPAPEYFVEVEPQTADDTEREYVIEPETPETPSFVELTDSEKVEAVYEQNRRLEAELLDLREQLALLIEANPRARRAARRNKN